MKKKDNEIKKSLLFMRSQLGYLNLASKILVDLTGNTDMHWNNFFHSKNLYKNVYKLYISYIDIIHTYTQKSSKAGTLSVLVHYFIWGV